MLTKNHFSLTYFFLYNQTLDITLTHGQGVGTSNPNKDSLDYLLMQYILYGWSFSATLFWGVTLKESHDGPSHDT